MKKKKFLSLLKLDYPLYKKYILYSLFFTGLIQFILCYSEVQRIYRDILDFDRSLQKNIVSNRIAAYPANALSNLLFPMVFYGFLVAAILLPAIFIYRAYIDTKSMYTLMRLPSSRTYYFLAKLFPSIVLSLLVWIVQFLYLMIYYCLYYLKIPKSNLPVNSFKNLLTAEVVQLIYPTEHPYRFISVISILILLPTMSFLLVCAERSKKKALFAVPILLVSGICLYLYVTTSSFPFWLLPCTTILTIFTARYYITKIQIV